MPTKPTRETSTKARKLSILSAALDCFCEKGVEATAVADIQRRAQCSVGSLYHHFGSKEGVAEELFIVTIQKLNSGMLRKLKRSKHAEESVKAVVFFYSDWSTRNPKLARYLHSRDIDFSPEAKTRLRALRREYIRSVFTWFAGFVERGDMAVLPADAYVPLISGPIQEYTRLWLAGHAGSPSNVKGLFAEAAWNAVKG